MKKIGIFFGPIGSSAEKVAKMIQQMFGSDNADIIAIREAKAQDMQKYDNIIMGMPTLGKDVWDSEKHVNGWDDFRPEFAKIDYTGKKIALFGLGDQISYPNNFVDSMGNIANRIKGHGAQIVGHVSTEGYEFNESNALIENDTKFVGLPINETHEPELTGQRLSKWIDQLKKEFI